MTWNHRVVRHRNGDLEIAEVMYGRFADVEPMGPNGEMGWSDARVYAEANEGLDSLRQQIEWFTAALDKPILEARHCEKACCADPHSAKREEK